MLTRFIEGGAPLRAADMRRPDLLRSAVGLLKRLHGSGLVFVLASMARAGLGLVVDEVFLGGGASQARPTRSPVWTCSGWP